MGYVHHKKGEINRNQRGSALVYILIAIALLAALTVTFMEPSSQQTQSQGTFKTVSELTSQVDFVRSSIQECVLLHQAGDKLARAAGNQKNSPYPLMPNDSYLDNCGADPSVANDLVENLRCPGKPKNNPCHADIFGAASGKFLAPPPPLFNDWHYYAGNDGVYIWIETDKTDAFIQTALTKLDDNFSNCESDIIDASGGQVELTSTAAAGDPKCPNGSTCFRLWIIAKDLTTHQDCP